VNGVNEISQMQRTIMQFIMNWVKKKKTAVPQQEIIKRMEKEGVKDFTTANALRTLCKKGYVKRGYTHTNRAAYVQIRSI